MKFFVVTDSTRIHQAEDLAQNLNGGVEWRLDCFKTLDMDYLRSQALKAKTPFICTLRSEEEGGYFKGSIKKQQDILMSILQIHPPFLDLEIRLGRDFLLEISKQKIKTKIISSLHYMDIKRSSISKILPHLFSFPGDIHKLAIMPKNSSENLEMINTIRSAKNNNTPFVGIIMGPLGRKLREKGLEYGNYISYLPANQSDKINLSTVFP